MDNAVKLIEKLIEKKQTISTMESCTGGYLAGYITNIDNSSKVFKFGAVTYSNDFKIKLGVNEATIKEFSVYSKEVAREMAASISDYTNSDYSVGVTGQINKIDELNKVDNDNQVYVSIYDKEKECYEDFMIECPKEKRSLVKEYIVNKIIEQLIKII